jgi:hypothetical protein
MHSDSLETKKNPTLEVGVYECEIHLKFRLIEEKSTLEQHDRLLETLLEAFSYGNDEYMEPIQVEVMAQAISELHASPEMRRQLIRLRNSHDLV